MLAPRRRTGAGPGGGGARGRGGRRASGGRLVGLANRGPRMRPTTTTSSGSPPRRWPSCWPSCPREPGSREAADRGGPPAPGWAAKPPPPSGRRSDGRRHPGADPGQRAGARLRPRQPRARRARGGAQGARQHAGRPDLHHRRRRGWAPASRSTSVQPHAAAVLGTTRGRHARPTRPAAIDGRGRRPPAGATLSFDDRAAILLKAADLLAGPWRETLNAATMLGQSKTAYQAEIDAACELIDFWRFNVALRPADPAPSSRSSVPGRLEPDRLPAARGLRLRDHAVQLHRDRRQPADRAGADGQHRGVEAVAHPAVRRALHDAAARGGRAAAGRHQPGDRRRPRGLRGGARRPGPRRHPLHRLDRDVPAPVARRSATNIAGYRTLPAPRRRDRRQGLRPRPPVAPTRTCCAPR